jgi:HD-GYP domain-containing protein (c-di-GMP phosphodiesterase class II)
MASGSRTFRVRACILTGVVCAAAAGLIAGASGSIWLAAAAMGSAVAGGCAISWWIALSQDALTTEAERAAALSIRHSQADLDRANVQFVETLAQILDARDPYTAGHSLRVGDYSYAIARAMDVPAQEAQNIRIAAQLHDIGKIGIPDAILQKRGALTQEEFGLIKLHPQIGRRILEKMGTFREFLPVIELHHENHNGTGYPFKLSGEQIPLSARIVHVADAFDSMVTHRHYRNALPLRKAIAELQVNSGTQFDPAAASVMLKLIGEGKLQDMLLSAEGRLDERLMGANQDVGYVPVEVTTL